MHQASSRGVGTAGAQLMSTGWWTHLLKIAEALANWWCANLHDAPMWPIHGQYRCRTCGRRQAVLWGRPTALAIEEGVPQSTPEAPRLV
jgi:hypothetical protein